VVVSKPALSPQNDHRIIELLPDTTCPPNNGSKSQVNEENDSSNKGLSTAMIEQKEMNTIQAVTSQWLEERRTLLFAVSRYDKSLAIYSILADEIGEAKAEDQTLPTGEGCVLKIKPIIIHKTNKRSCSLSFALIPPEDKDKKSIIIVVAGDLNGDATAYPTEMYGDNEMEKDKQLSRRILLGHTASVLTSVEIIGSKILTSDRDEKVRVSSFPQTFNVEGYLLGHSSYISDVKIIRTKLAGSKCITCSGDGTMRLFDYESFEQNTQINIPVQSQDKTDETDGKILPSPVRLAIDNAGAIVAVIYDAFNVVQLFSISIKSDGTASLKLMQDIECPSCPLGVIFGMDDSINILTTEPKIIKLFPGEDGLYIFVEDQISVMLNDIVGSQCTTMPKSLLEKDETTGKLKLTKKVNEGTDNFTKSEPWLKRERVEIYKAGVHRRKQRKFEKQRKSNN